MQSATQYRAGFLEPYRRAAGAALVLSILVGLALIGSAFAKDHSSDYQMGTFISSTAVSDGTITSTLHGDGTNSRR
jgi:NAD+--asparagine ADP-ribosyltransferase